MNTKEEDEYQVYADEFHKYSAWFVSNVKKEKEKITASYKNAINELKTEKQARERLQNDLVGKQKVIKKLTEENESLKADLKCAIEREKKMGQKSQKKAKCYCCDADSKFKVKEMMVCSYKCAKEAKQHSSTSK